MSTRYAVALHRIKEAERSQDPSELLSCAGNEMASIIRDGDSSLVELPIAWAGLAMVHKAQHEIAAAYESEQYELTEIEERAISSLKQVIYCFLVDIISRMRCNDHAEGKVFVHYLKISLAT